MQFIVPYDQLAVNPPGPWQNANPTSGIQGSIPNADVFPAVQNEILNILQEAGITPSGTDFAQAMRAIRSGQLWTFTDVSTTPQANAITIATRTAHTSLVKGLPFRVFPALTNTSTVVTLTIAQTGGGSPFTAAVRKRDQTAPAIGDIVATVPIDVVYDGTYFRVLNYTISDLQSYLSTISGSQAITIAQTIIANYPSISPPKNGRLIKTAGTFLLTIGGTGPNDPPADVTDVYVDLTAAGGGGSAASTSPNNYSGGGGASGGRTADWVRGLKNGDTITIVNGAGGLGGTVGNGNAGSTGGSTTVTSSPSNGPAKSLAATGGGGGAGGTTVCAGGTPGQGSGSALGFNLPGAPGGDGNPTNVNIQGGAGGASAFGGGGRTSTLGPNSGNTAANGLAPGTGGGAIWQNTDGTEHGGNGADGGVYVQW